MDNKVPYISSLTYDFNEISGKIVCLDIVDSQSALNSTRDVNFRAHFSQTISHQFRLFHQTGTKTAALDPRTRTSNVEVDLIIA